MLDEQFVRNRITELRLKKNISEYQMSLDLGKNKSLYSGYLFRAFLCLP